MLRQLLTGLTAVIFFLTTLAGRGAEAQPERSKLSAAIDALSQTVSSGTSDHTDDLLKKIGYGPQFTSQVADWNNLSSYRKIETMALAAERAPRGSAERALALMSQAMARTWPAHLEELAIQKLPEPGTRPIQFVALRSPSPRPLAPHVDDAVYALASYVDEGTMSVSMLLRQAGVAEPRIMNLVRSHATARDVLTAAVAMQGTLPKQHEFMHELLNRAEPFYPAIAHDADVVRFRESGPRPEHPGAIVPPQEMTPPRGSPEPPNGSSQNRGTSGPHSPIGPFGEEIRPPHPPGSPPAGEEIGPRANPGRPRPSGEVGPSRPIKARPRPPGPKPNPGAIWGNVRCHVK